jgi:hypothetical protein
MDGYGLEKSQNGLGVLFRSDRGAPGQLSSSSILLAPASVTTANATAERYGRHFADKCVRQANVFPRRDCDVCWKAVTMWTVCRECVLAAQLGLRWR